MAVSSLYIHNKRARSLSSHKTLSDTLSSVEIDPKVLETARVFRKHMIEVKNITKEMYAFNTGHSEMQFLTNKVDRLGDRVDIMSQDMEIQKK